MTTDAGTAPAGHGLLLAQIPHWDASLDETFHSIHQALLLVHRLTIVISARTREPNAFKAARGLQAANGGSDSKLDLVAKATGSAIAPEAAFLDKKSLSSTSLASMASASSTTSVFTTFHSVQRVLSALYVSFTKHAMALERPLAELDIVLEDSCGYEIGAAEDEIPFDVFLGVAQAVEVLNELNAKRTKNGAKTLPIITLKTAPSTLSSPDSHLVDAIDCCVPNTKVEEGQYSDVALGGTFDHLHAGHKILLSMTAWVTSHRIVCGVSDEELLKTKKYKDFLEPLDKRVHAVEKFLRIFKRSLVYEVVPLHDIYGPTITDKQLQALMVSLETMKGAAAVNQERLNRHLPPLKIEVINVISPTETEVDEVSLKISSTYIRQYLSELAASKASVATGTTS
ncbi:hypothetical protein BG000_004188 [Podila horticola]|nr:hypothetical protein BG000_004188 [Podila horticola]